MNRWFRRHRFRPSLQPLEGRLTPTVGYGWAQAVGGAGIDMAADVARDAAGNVYVAGTFRGISDFDPGPGTLNPTSGSLDAFVWKLDQAGHHPWAKQPHGTRHSAATRGPR